MLEGKSIIGGEKVNKVMIKEIFVYLWIYLRRFSKGDKKVYNYVYFRKI